jgi:hypothetical protein
MPLFSDASALFNRPKKPLDIKSCGSDAAVLASSSLRSKLLRSDGGKKAVHRGEHEVSRKAIAQAVNRPENPRQINGQPLMCSHLCRDPQELLIAVHNSAMHREPRSCWRRTCSCQTSCFAELTARSARALCCTRGLHWLGCRVPNALNRDAHVRPSR